MIRKSLFLMLCALVSGCSAFSLGDLQTEGAKASALCIKGGYAMAGGTVASAKANGEFKGRIVIGPDCSLALESE